MTSDLRRTSLRVAGNLNIPSVSESAGREPATQGKTANASRGRNFSKNPSSSNETSSMISSCFICCCGYRKPLFNFTMLNTTHLSPLVRTGTGLALGGSFLTYALTCPTPSAISFGKDWLGVRSSTPVNGLPILSGLNSELLRLLPSIAIQSFEFLCTSRSNVSVGRLPAHLTIPGSNGQPNLSSVRYMRNRKTSSSEACGTS